MTLSPASWFWNQPVQLFDYVLDGKASRACASHAISNDLGQLPLAFRLSASQLLCADKSTRPLVGLQQSAKFEFAVGSNNGIGIDGQVDCELTHRGKLVADGKRPGSNSAAYLIDDLAIHRYTALKVKPEAVKGPTRNHHVINVLVY
jgi:hypothetical protein